jgi:hypothetical protein
MRKQASPAAATEQRKESGAGLPTAPLGECAPRVLALINKVALDACADVEKLDRVMALYERLKAKEAELAYNAAKSRILKKLAGIKIVKTRPALCEIEKGKPQNGACIATPSVAR